MGGKKSDRALTSLVILTLFRSLHHSSSLHRSATVVSLLVPLPTVGRRPPARYAVDGETEGNVETEGTEDTGEAGRALLHSVTSVHRCLLSLPLDPKERRT